MEEILKKLYSQPLSASRTGLFYNTFAYPTKIAPESIAVYIAAHTNPGDTVLDVFGGSGSTGLAALMCEHPTQTVLDIAKEIGVSPMWGARNAVIYEIGTYGAFASRVMTNPPSKEAFKSAVQQLLLLADNDLSGIYNVIDPNGDIGTIRHVIWSDVLRCPSCKREFTYYEGMVRRNPMQILKIGKCPYCGHSIEPDNHNYVLETVNDNLLGHSITRRKRLPIYIYGETNSVKWSRSANEDDVERFQKIENSDYTYSMKPRKIEWGDLYRSGYHTGITHLHHFYTKRNYEVMCYLWNKAVIYPADIRNAIRLLLLSYNSAHATLMTRVVVKKNSKDFVLTGAQSGVLYVSSLPVEKNILIGIKRKSNYFAKAFEYVNNCSGHVEIINASSQHLSQSDNSVDYVFTDPPFGDFIPYAEVNQINELWLSSKTNRKNEIIISNAQNKSIDYYQKMMTDVFAEVYRVLKDGANATVVFHASKAAIWNALSSAYSSAGFRVETTATLKRNQESFKQVVSEFSVQGDPLILLKKGKAEDHHIAAYKLLDAAIANQHDCTKHDERYIYANYVSMCLEQSTPVELDAKTAYNYILRNLGENV